MIRAHDFVDFAWPHILAFVFSLEAGVTLWQGNISMRQRENVLVFLSGSCQRLRVLTRVATLRLERANEIFRTNLQQGFASAAPNAQERLFAIFQEVWDRNPDYCHRYSSPHNVATAAYWVLRQRMQQTYQLIVRELRAANFAQVVQLRERLTDFQTDYARLIRQGIPSDRYVFREQP